MLLYVAYRMLHLKRKHNYNIICQLRCHQYKTHELFLAFFQRCGSSCLSTLSDDGHVSRLTYQTSPQFCYQSAYRYVQYFLVLMYIAKSLTKCRKLLRCEVIFEDEYTIFAPAQRLRSWLEQFGNFWLGVREFHLMAPSMSVCLVFTTFLGLQQ